MSVPQLKDLGRVTKFLGINFDYDETSGWMLDQKQTIKEMLERFNLSGANPVRVHIGGEQDDEAEDHLLPNGEKRTPVRPTVKTSQSLVGSLL
ncbi:hypothetical protein PF003_g825 [Phytophthora fragariae]|nr:hypothetical protein PF003_g825 [Phytophthora fragariae]